MQLGQTYQIPFLDGTNAIFKFWGDRNNVQDAVEILESTAEKFSLGELVSLNVLNSTPHKKIIPVNR